MTQDARTVKIGKRVVDAATPEAKAYRLWDADLKGFGIKVLPSGAKTYFVWYRAGEGRAAARREYTLARHGVMTPEQARQEAAKVLSRVRLGEDPQRSRTKARKDMTVGDLCDLYLIDGVATKKASTVSTDKSRIKSHIKPLLGRKPVASITSADVERFLADVGGVNTAVARKPTRTAANAAKSQDRRRRTDPAAQGGKGTATRTVGLLGSILAFAMRQGLRTDNPVRGVSRFKDRQSQRYLKTDELGRLANALAAAERDGANTQGVTVIRLLAFTGARKSEIEGLKWSEVDLEHSCLRLEDSKTGFRIVPLGPPALVCLQAIQRLKSAIYVFPSQGGESHYVGTPRIWKRVRKAAELEGVRLHDLRHTYASFGITSGLSLPLIAAILGHKDVKTTQQYAHLADDPVKAAAAKTALAVSEAMAAAG
jgi:integrase